MFHPYKQRGKYTAYLIMVNAFFNDLNGALYEFVNELTVIIQFIISEIYLIIRIQCIINIARHEFTNDGCDHNPFDSSYKITYLRNLIRSSDPHVKATSYHKNIILDFVSSRIIG